jgi:hypothetical protein
VFQRKLGEITAVLGEHSTLLSGLRAGVDELTAEQNDLRAARKADAQMRKAFEQNVRDLLQGFTVTVSTLDRSSQCVRLLEVRRACLA